MRRDGLRPETSPSTPTRGGGSNWSALASAAAAQLHSLAGNHPLVDGNKRLAWLATYVFLAKNGTLLDADDDAAYEFVVAVADGSVDDVGQIAAILASFAASPRD